jgi:hypothetical protein
MGFVAESGVFVDAEVVVVDDLIMPDVLTPSQWFDRHHRAGLEPIKKLMLAILEDALHCYQNGHGATHGARKRLFDDANAWLFAESRGSTPFSFERVCEALEIDAGWFRRGMREWAAQLDASSARRLVARRRGPVGRMGAIKESDARVRS